MAWRFRKVPIVSGEVVHPDTWVQNHMDYAGEFNGRLDRDNLPSNLLMPMQVEEYTEPWTTKNIALTCFHKIESDAYTAAEADKFFFRYGSAEWAAKQSDIDSTTDDSRLGQVKFTAKTEGMIIAHWTGWLEGEPNYAPNVVGKKIDYFANEDFYQRASKFANFRIVVNGTEVANSGKHSAAWPNQCVAMTGATPVEAGEVTITVEGRAGVLMDLEFDMRAFTGQRAIFAVRARELLVIFKTR